MATKDELLKIILNHEGRIATVEECVRSLQVSIDDIKKNSNATRLIVLYVVVPLIVILGALVGIKIMLP